MGHIEDRWVIVKRKGMEKEKHVYIARWTDEYGKRKSKRCPNMRLAEQVLAAKETDVIRSNGSDKIRRQSRRKS